MFSLDRWQEIFDTLLRNKLRTVLTAFAMAWGIFMLVFLLGLGNGLQAGVQQGFKKDATNSIWMFGGRTAKPANGLPIGRRIQFKNRDVGTVAALEGVDRISGQYFLRGANIFGGEQMVRVGAKAQPFPVRAVHPDYQFLENAKIVAGRFLNEIDFRQRRKVAVLGAPAAEFLFGGREAAVGQWCEINRVPFLVAGVFTDEGQEQDKKAIYIPISTGQATFNGSDRVNSIMFTVGDATVDESKAIATAAVAQLAETHGFAVDDPQAIRVNNTVEQFAKFQQIFAMIKWFVAGMACCALLAGIVGVSNIMMIAVRERTKEIGVRKALGATPANIVGTIVQEAVFLTAFAGYLGLVAGVGLLALIEKATPPNEMFGAPTIDLWVAVIATIGLVIAGALAGFFPALQAAKVNPIVALRDE